VTRCRRKNGGGKWKKGLIASSKVVVGKEQTFKREHKKGGRWKKRGADKKRSKDRYRGQPKGVFNGQGMRGMRLTHGVNLKSKSHIVARNSIDS